MTNVNGFSYDLQLPVAEFPRLLYGLQRLKHVSSGCKRAMPRKRKAKEKNK